MILNINQLRAFHSAAKLKSVAKAARELMVTPPAISKQIKLLEETLDLKLMFRYGNSIQLTEIGTSVFEKSESIFGQIKEMENFLGNVSTAKSGQLVVCCPQTPAEYVMPILVSKFNDIYPGIKIIIDQGTTAELVEKILNHKTELGLLMPGPYNKRLKVKVMGTRDLVLVAAPNSVHLPADEISITQLSSIPLIVSKEGSAIRDVVFQYLRRFRVTPFIAMECVSTSLTKQLVLQDRGVAFLVEYTVNEDLKNKVLKPVTVLEGSPIIKIGVGYLQKKYLSPAAWAFLRVFDELKSTLP